MHYRQPDIFRAERLPPGGDSFDGVSPDCQRRAAILHSQFTPFFELPAISVTSSRVFYAQF